MIHEERYFQFLENNLHDRKLKSLEVIQGFSSIYVMHKGKKIINFSSSDYLGLSNHPALIKQSQYYAERYGVGSSSSRLVTGNFEFYDHLEKKLAQSLGKPSALIMGTGYQANLTVLEALFDRQVLGDEPLIFCDKLCHVSMLSMSRHFSRLQRFAHNDLQHLCQLLDKYKNDTRPKFILAESVYSMEGDTADLSRLIKIAEEYQAFLYIDDAHSVGVYGEKGWGMASTYAKDISILMGTFSKGLGSFGGYVGCTDVMKKYLVNKCRGLIYSTGLSPAVLGAIDAVIDLVPQLTQQRQRLLKKADEVREFFKTENLEYGMSLTHIIPWILGDAKMAVRASELLEEQGILATAIQPPSVPQGKSRVRFCLSAAHTDEDIQCLLQALQTVKPKLQRVTSPLVGEVGA